MICKKEKAKTRKPIGKGKSISILDMDKAPSTTPIPGQVLERCKSCKSF